MKWMNYELTFLYISYCTALGDRTRLKYRTMIVLLNDHTMRLSWRKSNARG